VSSPATGTDAAIDRELTHLEVAWDQGMKDAYAHYRSRAAPALALAAALVETAVELQELGRRAAEPPRLLLGDLCLARASRLLAEHGDSRMQIGFARAVERVSAAAAAGTALPSLRAVLTETIGDA
jgi:hypothetical protein